MNSLYLGDFKEKLLIGKGWEEIDITNTSFKIYYKKGKNNIGFEFYVLNRIEWNNDNWNDEEDKIEILCSGSASFDGIRHLYFGSEFTDNYGYCYYPNFEDIIKIMKALKGLEMYGK